MVWLTRICASLFLGQGVGEEGFFWGMAYLLTVWVLGSVALTASFISCCRHITVGFSIATIAVWLLCTSHLLAVNHYNFLETVAMMLQWEAILFLHLPLLLGLAALIVLKYRRQKPAESAQ